MAAIEPDTAGRRLHIGGTIRIPGWEVINVLPGEHVDHLGNANDLSRFADETFATIYASHVLEHFDYARELLPTLAEWARVLKLQRAGFTKVTRVRDLGLLNDASVTLFKGVPISLNVIAEKP